MFEELTPAELAEQARAGELWLVLDVRESWEIELARLEQARHIPMAEVPGRVGELDASRPVAVLCHSGGRSARVAAFLAERGFARVANVVGGIDAWAATVDATIPRY